MKIETVRKTYKNIKKIKSLDTICFPDIAPPKFGPKQTFCWLVDDVAYAIAYKVKNFLFLSRAGVLPDHRGQGIQKKLIEARIKKAKELGLNGVCTYTSTNNIASIKNIKFCGLNKEAMPAWLDINDTNFVYWELKF